MEFFVFDFDVDLGEMVLVFFKIVGWLLFFVELFCYYNVEVDCVVVSVCGEIDEEMLEVLVVFGYFEGVLEVVFFEG